MLTLIDYEYKYLNYKIYFVFEIRQFYSTEIKVNETVKSIITRIFFKKI